MDDNTQEYQCWLPTAPEPSHELIVSLEQATRNVQNATRRAVGSSRLADEIATAFTTFFPTLFVNGKAIAFACEESDQTRFKQSREICFIPKSEFARMNNPALYYRYDWRTVMMAGIGWPEPFFTAVTMHELGHALRHNNGVNMKMFSPEWISEEVDMHELETSVIDHLTAGRYTQKIRRICSQYPKAQSAIELMTMISASDLIELDEITDTSKSGRTVRGTACAQYVLTLGFQFVVQHKGTSQDKMSFYQWFIRK
ncbi:MAG: hypothetical protein NT077_03235 [Candidatus Taylorbacteria bacterium]|nr:hypothetical protein [Candidatus Taylorbacteria bacterium]